MFIKNIITWLLLFTCIHAFADDGIPETELLIDAKITTHLGDNQEFTTGDIISFLVSIDKDSHLLIIYQDAEGNLIQLMPNSNFQNNFYPADSFISIPDNNKSFEFKVSAPYGKETLWLFASSQPLEKLNGEPLKNGLILLNDDMQSIQTTLKSKARTSNAAFGQAKTQIKTRP